MSTLKTNNIQHVDRSDPSIIISTDGGVSIAGTLTYEDVTNIDAVGIVTGRELINAQKQIHVGTGVSVKAGGINVTAGITTVQALQAQAISGTTGTFTGDITISNADPRLTFTDSNENPDYYLQADSGQFKIVDSTNSASRLVIQTDGTIDISGNLDANGGLDVTGDGTFTGALSVGSGANSATQKAAFLGGYTIFENTAGTGNPSITFNNDTDTGILNPAANTLAFDTGGTERLRITSAGKIGINTTTTTSTLQIYGANEGEGTATGQITLKDTAAYNATPTGGIIFQGHHTAGSQAIFSGIRGFKENTSDGNYAGALAFDVRAHGAVAYEALRIDSYGALLVGTDAPIYTSGDMRHEIKKNNSRTYSASNMVAHPHLLFNNSDTTDTAFTGIGFRAGNGDGAIGYVYRGSANVSDFVVLTDGNSNGTERLRITNGGAVLIGAASDVTSTPAARLTIDCQGLSVLDDVGAPGNYGLIFANDPTTNKANGIGFFNDSSAAAGGYIIHEDKGSNNIGDIVFGTAESSDAPVERLRILYTGVIQQTGIYKQRPDTSTSANTFYRDVKGPMFIGPGGTTTQTVTNGHAAGLVHVFVKRSSNAAVNRGIAYPFHLRSTGQSNLGSSIYDFSGTGGAPSFNFTQANQGVYFQNNASYTVTLQLTFELTGSVDG